MARSNRMILMASECDEDAVFKVTKQFTRLKKITRTLRVLVFPFAAWPAPLSTSCAARYFVVVFVLLNNFKYSSSTCTKMKAHRTRLNAENVMRKKRCEIKIHAGALRSSYVGLGERKPWKCCCFRLWSKHKSATCTRKPSTINIEHSRKESFYFFSRVSVNGAYVRHRIAVCSPLTNSGLLSNMSMSPNTRRKQKENKTPELLRSLF